MSKINTIILFVFVILLAIVGGFFVYSYILRDSGKNSINTQSTNNGEGEYVFEQGTRQIYKGTFTSATDTAIFYEEEGKVKELPLGDNIMVLCTDQDLNELTLDNYYQEEGMFFSQKSVNNIAPSGEFIAMVSSQKSGSPTVHTLIFASNFCPEEPKSLFY